MTRSELLAAMDALRAEKASGIRKEEQLDHDLQVHQAELEMQNEALRETQGELEDSVNRYSDLYDLAPIGYATFDAAGLIQEINLTAAVLIGVDRRRLIGIPFLAYLPKDQAQQFLTYLHRVKAEGRATIELDLDSRSLGLRRIELQTIKVEMLPAGISYLSAISDITMHKEYEEERRLFGQLKNVVEFLPYAIFVLDREKRVIAWNRALEEMTGATKDTILGTHDYSIPFYGERRPILIDYLEEDDDAARLNYPTMEREGGMLTVQNYVPTLFGGKGALVWVKCAPLLDERGQRIGAIELIQDITRQRILEEEFLKVQKLESLGLLAGGIAHDFNNYLAAVAANAQLVRTRAERGFDISANLKTIEDVVNKAAGLTRQLLTFARGGAPVKKIIALADLVRETAAFALGGTNICQELQMPKGLWPVEADESQISQVISNLMINAIEAMPEGGAIAIKGENISVRSRSSLPLPPGRYAKIAITDSGVGITAENLKRIFDPYFTTKERGKGLGLTASYSIMSRHGGYIDVISQEGFGSTFCLYLPAAAARATAPDGQQKMPGRGQGRLLLMDDEEDFRTAAGEMLRNLGYMVVLARNGEEAIRLYQAARSAGASLEVLILDLTVPGGLGGKDLVARLRRDGADFKAIACSGYSNDPVMADCQAYGFQDAIVKPFRVEQLNAKIQRLQRLV